jgi:hypothetical protein
MARCSFCRKRGRIGREYRAAASRAPSATAPSAIGIAASANSQDCGRVLATSREIIDGRTRR